MRSRRAAALALLVLAAVALVALLGWDDVRQRQDAARQAAAAQRQLRAASAQNARLGSQLAALQASDAQLQQEARNPTLSIWNSCGGGPCTVGPGTVRVGSAPDTFQLQVSFTSDTPIHTYFFTFHQWTQFDGCGFSLRCVTGSPHVLDAATSVNQNFDDAEGCSGYVWVLQSDAAGTIRPDVKARYLPADHPTGVCATSP
jgi:type II secretory pathway pseudopilin PulG